MLLEDEQRIGQGTGRSMINQEGDQSLVGGLKRTSLRRGVRLLKLQLSSAPSEHVSQNQEARRVISTVFDVLD